MSHTVGTLPTDTLVDHDLFDRAAAGGLNFEQVCAGRLVAECDLYFVCVCPGFHCCYYPAEEVADSDN